MATLALLMYNVRLSMPSTQNNETVETVTVVVLPLKLVHSVPCCWGKDFDELEGCVLWKGFR